MNSKILNAMGLQSLDPMIIILVLALFCIILLVMNLLTNNKLKKMCNKYEKFMMGKDLESMEDIITTRFSQIDHMLKDTAKNVEDINKLYTEMKSVVQKTGIVKYDAFNEMGGKLSFALVMLDGNNNGFVINAMHSREGCYTYIKEIINGESYIPLGTEEKEALNQALELIEE